MKRLCEHGLPSWHYIVACEVVCMQTFVEVEAGALYPKHVEALYGVADEVVVHYFTPLQFHTLLSN